MKSKNYANLNTLEISNYALALDMFFFTRCDVIRNTMNKNTTTYPRIIELLWKLDFAY